MTALVIKNKGIVFLVASIYIPHDKEDAAKIHEEISILLQEYKLQMPIALLGDFNGKPDPVLDHYHQPGTNEIQPATSGDKKVRKLLNPRGNRPMLDSFRVINKDFVQYSNFTAGAKTRIDLAILNDLAMDKCTESTISANSIDPALSHRSIRVKLRFSTAKLLSKPQKNIKKESKINWKKVTKEMVESLQQEVDSDAEIAKAYNEIKSQDPANMTNKEIQKLVNNNYSAISRAILRNTKRILPLIKEGQNPINSCAKITRLRKDRKDLVEITALAKSNSIIDKVLASNRLQILFDRYSPEDLDDSPDKIKYVERKLNQHLKKAKEKMIAEKVASRQVNFAMRQKQEINNIMDRRKDFDGLVCAKDPITGEITIEQKEVEAKAVEHFHAKMSKTSNPVPNPNGAFINMDEVNTPLEEIVEEYWSTLMTKITEEDILHALKGLPKNKACGLDAIPNEILQIVVSPGTRLLEIIKISMNITVQYQIYPTKITEGLMVMLPKIDNWNGELDKLRPITLLNTLHKLFERIMNDRLCDILHKYKILKGPNFGFQAGQGTGDPLFIVSNLLAFCKEQGVDFYTSTLDIAACFDKLPWEAIENGLNRIKAPANFIKMLKAMQYQRKLFIRTPFGKTKGYWATIGVPQGGILSPILWLIAYDPLLHTLQTKTVGLAIPKGIDLLGYVKICCLAYADDLQPVASSPEDLQLQLDIIFEFLTYYNMSMNPGKSHVMTNIPADELNFPNDSTFSLGGVDITVKQPEETTRILGVFMSMDSAHAQTSELAVNNLKIAVNIVSSKATPGSLGAKLAKTVIMPQVLYRLQNSYLSKNKLTEINGQFRKLTKRKMSLPKSTRNTALEDKRYKLSLDDFQTVHETALISNFLVYLTSISLIGEFTRAMVDFTSQKEKVKISLVEGPINFPPAQQKLSIIKMISTFLYRNSMQIRKPMADTLPILNLSVIDYNKYHKEFVRYKINSLSDLKRTGHDKTLDYTTFCNAHRSRYKIKCSNLLSSIY
jgi:hypothetical protein